MERINFDKVGERLKKARELKHITLEDAGKFIGVHKSTILRWENGETEKLKLPMIEKLAIYYDVNSNWLVGFDFPMERTLSVAEESAPYYYNNKQAFPLLGTVKAGYNYLAQENIIGYVNIDKEVSDPENYFALKVVGESMQPIMYEDDIVIVHRQNDIESNQIGIILINDEEATVKKVVKHEDYIELIAFNPYFTPKKLDKSATFKIIGKVTEARISKIFE